MCCIRFSGIDASNVFCIYSKIISKKFFYSLFHELFKDLLLFPMNYCRFRKTKLHKKLLRNVGGDCNYWTQVTVWSLFGHRGAHRWCNIFMFLILKEKYLKNSCYFSNIYIYVYLLFLELIEPSSVLIGIHATVIVGTQ